jgi:hypothetical protein
MLIPLIWGGIGHALPAIWAIGRCFGLKVTFDTIHVIERGLF